MAVHSGSCHCGRVRFEADFEIENPRRCNCSLCRRKGAVMHAVAADKLKVLSGEDNLSTYQFGTGTAKHYFCKTCGIYPFHVPRVAPDRFAVNLGCFDDIALDTLNIGTFDGRTAF